LLYSRMISRRRPFKKKVVRWLRRNLVYLFLILSFMIGMPIGAIINYSAQAADDGQIPVTATVEQVEATACVAAVWEPAADDVEILAKLIWGEARGIPSTTEKAAVVWCVLNRVDASSYPDTVRAVVTQKHQFAGYSPDFPATEEFKAIAYDVLLRWHSEKEGTENSGRVLPKEYLYFTGDGYHNYFKKRWSSSADTYNWVLPTPYSS